MAVTAVFLDVGETLSDETAYWGWVADKLGIPWLTFFAGAGALIERGERDHCRSIDSLDELPEALGGV